MGWDGMGWDEKERIEVSCLLLAMLAPFSVFRFPFLFSTWLGLCILDDLYFLVTGK